VLTVTRLDRLARSTRDLLNILAEISKHGAQFKSLADSWADKPDLVAIDGKTSRRSHDHKRGQKALHLVSAFATTDRLVLGQEATDEKIQPDHRHSGAGGAHRPPRCLGLD
jgi:hypothetical protein